VYLDPHILCTPSIADIDGDGRDELVVAVSYFFDREYYDDPAHAGEVKGLDISKYVAGGWRARLPAGAAGGAGAGALGGLELLGLLGLGLGLGQPGATGATWRWGWGWGWWGGCWASWGYAEAKHAAAVMTQSLRRGSEAPAGPRLGGRRC
jgi:hypothetical protein